MARKVRPAMMAKLPLRGIKKEARFKENCYSSGEMLDIDT
jgi:hypothetical protein